MNVDFVTISDEAVPLSSAPENTFPFFPVTIIGMLIIIIAVFLIFYVSECRRYRSRYSSIKGNDENKSWNIFKLKKLVHEAENELAEQMI